MYYTYMAHTQLNLYHNTNTEIHRVQKFTQYARVKIICTLECYIQQLTGSKGRHEDIHILLATGWVEAFSSPMGLLSSGGVGGGDDPRQILCTCTWNI